MFNPYVPPEVEPDPVEEEDDTPIILTPEEDPEVEIEVTVTPTDPELETSAGSSTAGAVFGWLFGFLVVAGGTSACLLAIVMFCIAPKLQPDHEIVAQIAEIKGNITKNKKGPISILDSSSRKDLNL